MLFTPEPLAAFKSEDELYFVFFAFQPGLTLSFQVPGFHSAGRHPKATTRKTNERTTYHGSDPMQIVLLHRCKTVLSNADIGATLLKKGAPQTPSQNFCFCLRIPQAALARQTAMETTGAACGIRKRYK